MTQPTPHSGSAAARRMTPPLPTSSPARRCSSPLRRCTTIRPRSICWWAAAGPRPDDVSLDVACGPGSVVVGVRPARAPRRRPGLHRGHAGSGAAAGGEIGGSRTSSGTGATSTRCPSRMAPSTSSAAATRSITCRSRRARSPRWCASPAPAAASCCAMPWPPTIPPRPPPSTPWSATAIPRRWSSARSASCAACSPTPACPSRG